MIINTEQNNIEVIGDIKEFKTSIDPKNIDFITTLLSSNLYSDPEQSFIREIVSNAWDSHVEAGTTNIPVVVRFKDNSITIRDFGVGLSPERFQEVYCNIGSSTKRESNDYLGGFGIGKYSTLACSNTAYITSYYEGIEYHYVMIKNGNSITTNLIMEIPTTEKNGVEVTIKNIKDQSTYEQALKCITFFPNVYIYGCDNANTINNIKIKRFTNFSAASTNIRSKILLGNVLYPCNRDYLSPECKTFLFDIDRTGIVINFNVGELNITPNRENIIYSSDTITKIEKRILDAKEELHNLIITKLTKDYDDILEYYKILVKQIEYSPITNSIDRTPTQVGYRIFPYDIQNLNITYKGINLKKDFHSIRAVMTLELPNFKGFVHKDKIHNKNIPWNMQNNGKISSEKVVILNNVTKLSPTLKLYLREQFDGYGIITTITQQEFINYIDKVLTISTTNKRLIITGIFDSLMRKAKILDVNTNAEYLQYKTSLTTTKLSSVKEVRYPILYVLNRKGYKETRHFQTFSEVIAFIKSLRRGVLLVNMDADDDIFFSIAKIKGYVLIKARKNIVSDLKTMNLKCLVDINWATKEDPLLSKVKAIIQEYPIDEFVSTGRFKILQILETVSDKDKIKEDLIKIVNILHLCANNIPYTYLTEDNNIKADPYTIDLCKNLKYYIDKYQDTENFVKENGCSNNNCGSFITAILIRNKSYRVSSKSYIEYKNNKLINVLCKK